jgi:hypothetical protein
MPPQLFAAAQLTDQSTPAAAGSLATIAVTEAVRAEPTVATYRFVGKTLIVTGTGEGGDVIVSVALTDFVVSASDVAVIVTVPPVGTTAGAVYVLE